MPEKKLNKEQLDAVKHKDGPLLIIAGAGTGKTTVITERIKNLILSGSAKASEILALTFTEKAAREMETRVDVAMPYGFTQMWIMTFHSFCDRVLRLEALNIGYNPRYKLLTQASSIQLVRKNLFNFELDYFRPLGNPNKFIEAMLNHFSRLQDEDITPQEYSKWVRAQIPNTADEKLEIKKHTELASAYKIYDELKVKEGYMDFGDLIVKTLKLFRERKNILTQYQKQFKYVLVDEFQDTNYAQNELAIVLSQKNKNIAVCGDDDQSIYRFRGAAVSNILQFKRHFPKTKIVTLNKNYRSSQEILDRAYRLINFNNPDRLEVIAKVDKKLKSQIDYPETEIKFFHTDRVENEADTVAKKVASLVSEKKYKYSDFAILVRANNHAEPFGRALSRNGIPYQFLGPGRLFRQPEVVDLISYLKVLFNIDDSVALYRLISLPPFDIPPIDISRIGIYARKNNVSLFEAFEKISGLPVSVHTQKVITQIISQIKSHLGLIRKESAGQLLYYFLENMQLLPELLNPKNSEAQKRAVNISRFFDKLKTYEVEHDDATVVDVVDWIDLATELGESPLATDTDWTEVNAVNILTVHSSKGLEFPVVFLVNLTSQRFPTIERREQIPIPEALIKEVLPVGDYHMQEERRLFYVGMTRACKMLYFTASNFYGEGKREMKLSPFIFEALGDEITSSEVADKHEQLSFLDYKKYIQESSNNDNNVHIHYLSYSQIETFRICPLHFKLKYLMKIPALPSSPQSFGNSFHLALKDFYDKVAKGNKPTLDLIYEALSANWVSEGYLSKIHERESLAKAKRFLKFHYNNYFDPKNLPVATEQPFLVKINDLRLGGKIDRIDANGEGIEIIDYKTGAKALTQKEADRDLQLCIYAIAASVIDEPPFKRGLENIKLSLYYYDDPKIVTTTRTKDDVDKAIVEIDGYRREIENSDFTCSGNILCKTCEYKLLCADGN